MTPRRSEDRFAEGVSTQKLDLDSYLERIGYDGAREPTLATLVAVQTAHLAQIPFENIDVRLGRPVSLDLEALQAKLVRSRRGGYCFEQNTLFAAVLRDLGFAVETLEARVRPARAREPLPRTHMLLRVLVAGRSWLADVGFGGDGPLEPVAFDGTASETSGGAYRIEREPREIHVLQWRWRGEWRDLYAFSLSPALPVDFAVANYFTSTHPDSIFVRTLTAQCSSSDGRHILRGQTYTRRCGEEETEREISKLEVPRLLRQVFGLELTDAEVLRALG